MSPNVHVMLVSAQAAPNLLAALDPDLKPQEAVLLVSGKMQARADALEAVLKEAGVRTARVPLEDEHDFARLENALLDVASRRDGDAVALNVTGGTKLMALAAQSVAQAAGWPVFYVDVDTDEVIWLGPQGKRQKLNQHLRLRHYLLGYGFQLPDDISRPQPNRKYEALRRTLVAQVGCLEQPLSQLNWLAQQAEDRGQLEIAITPELRDCHHLEALLRHFEEACVLAVRNDRLCFSDDDARTFAKGGWLEHHVYSTVSSLSGPLEIRDKAANLVVVDGAGVKNELDVAFLARNRLFAIECKTARMDRPEAPKANDTLYKLSEVCRRVGGVGTRGMLVSYRPLRDAEKRLAKALSIEIVCSTDLVRLDEKLKGWVKS